MAVKSLSSLSLRGLEASCASFMVGSAVLPTSCDGGFVTGSDCVINAVRCQEVVLGSIGFVRLQEALSSFDV